MTLASRVSGLGEGLRGGPYLGHDGGGEGAAVVDPAVHAPLRVSLAPVGGHGVGVQGLPLWVAETATLVGPKVGPGGMETARRAWGSGAPGTLAWAVLLSRRGTQQWWLGTAAEKFPSMF